MNWDFSQEEEQIESNRFGPVPAGSVVIVEMTLLEPRDDSRAHDDPFVKIAARSRLRMLYAELRVTRGEYADCSWRQHITLPCGMQTIDLSPNYQTACKIGGATLKAMLKAARKPMQLDGMKVFNGLRFPVKVKIGSRPVETQSGTTYWVNEIAKVITPDMPEYAEVSHKGEIINHNGAVTASPGKEREPKREMPRADPFGPLPSTGEYDSVPF